MTLEKWMAEVNRILDDRIGLTADDLPDKTYKDWFESGMSPAEAADEVIEEELPE